ncbi:MAG: hypothetical protein ACM3PS_07460 [Syntrophothermus sp.]
MGRYTSYQKRKESVKRNEVHPVMRGIGCILLVLVPIIAYGAAVYLVDYGIKKGWPIPPTWLGIVHIPTLLLKLSGLSVIWRFLQAQNNLTANLIFALAIAIVIFGILAILYGFMYKLFGPPEYGPTDVPPIRGRKVKRYKR